MATAQHALTGAGELFIVATPIGNLEDISERARRILGQVDAILAEDTRRTSRLMLHLGASTPLESYHDHNERRQVGQLVDRLMAGARLALVSDAGTPLVSDPGFWLVRAAREAGVRITPVPGASALITALSVSGLPTDRFVFEGFLPAKSGARSRALARLAHEARTIVFYEAPHRIRACLLACEEAFSPDRPAAIARELTKRFETVVQGTLGELSAWLEAYPEQQRGEFVLLVAGVPDGEDLPPAAVSEDVLLRGLLEVLPPGRAAALAAKTLGLPRNRLYDRALSLANRNDGNDSGTDDPGSKA